MIVATCVCGKEKALRLQDVKTNRIQSCGCLVNKKRILKSNNSREYRVWHNMKQRCNNKKHPQYYQYGGRGIKVCERWKKSFNNFYIDMGDVPPQMSLDRINNSGNYNKDNCRWATHIEQANNRRNNNVITYNNKTHTAKEWAVILGISPGALYSRLRKGWGAEKALSTPYVKYKTKP